MSLFSKKLELLTFCVTIIGGLASVYEGTVAPVHALQLPNRQKTLEEEFTRPVTPAEISSKNLTPAIFQFASDGLVQQKRNARRIKRAKRARKSRMQVGKKRDRDPDAWMDELSSAVEAQVDAKRQKLEEQLFEASADALIEMLENDGPAKKRRLEKSHQDAALSYPTRSQNPQAEIDAAAAEVVKAKIDWALKLEQNFLKVQSQLEQDASTEDSSTRKRKRKAAPGPTLVTPPPSEASKSQATTRKGKADDADNGEVDLGLENDPLLLDSAEWDAIADTEENQ